MGCLYTFLKDYQDKRPNIKKYSMFKNLSYLDFSSETKNPTAGAPGLNLDRQVSIDQVFTDKEFGYTDLQITDTTKNYLLNGYFQSFKFSTDYITDIKKQLFKEIPDIVQYTEKIFNDALLNGVPVCIHVRRGDYLLLQHVHPVQTDEYYSECINKILSIEPNAYFLVFSDDVPFVRGWSVIRGKKYMIVDSDVETSFVLMSKCKHFIISNSSLSLLAYYFRDGVSQLCMPKKWFAAQGPKYDLNDLISDPENTFII